MINQSLDQITSMFAQAGWLGKVFLLVFAALLVNFVIRRIIKNVYNKTKDTKNRWDDAIVEALVKPLTWLVWGSTIAICLRIIFKTTGEPIPDYFTPIQYLAVVVLLAWFLLRLVKNIEHRLINKPRSSAESIDHSTIEAFAKLLRLSVIITAALVILQTLGFSISGVLAFGGIGGIAIGFASKDLLANFFGGLMIYLDRPFVTGDWIRSPDKDIEGTVENIGWRLTRIRRFDKRPLYVPNSIFTTIAVENPSRMTHRQINEIIGVRYEDVSAIRTIVDQIKEYLEGHEAIETRQTIIVNFTEFNASSLDIMVYAYTKTTDWVKYHEARELILLDIEKIIANNKAEIAFPTQTIHMSKQDGHYET